MSHRPSIVTTLALSALLLGVSRTGVAQHADTAVVTSSPIEGQVIDDSGRPLSHALVVLDGGYSRVTTDIQGRFRLRAAPGAHELAVTAIGYKPDTLRLTVLTDSARAVASDDSLRPLGRIVLSRAQQQLKAVTVEGIPAPFMAQTVTATTVTNVPALAEPDIFRAVSLLPGVSTPNDTRGRLHLAGGASDEVGIRLDGHPLQDPFHLFGLLGAFNTAALERADVLIHSIPPSMSDHLSGVIDLQSRTPAADPSRDVSVSVLATSASYAAPLPANSDVLATGRITYFDKLLPVFSHKAKVGGDEVPLYGFRDAILRFGHSSARWRVEQISFFTSDVLPKTGETHTAGYIPYNWNEYLLGARAERSGDRWSLNARVSTGRNNVEFDERVFRGSFLHNDYSRQSAAVEASTHGSVWQLRAGVSGDLRRNRQRWDYSGRREGPSPNAPFSYAADNRQHLVAYFGDIATFLHRVSFEDAAQSWWKLNAGGRVVSSGSAAAFAPSFGVEYETGSSWLFALAGERRYQFQGIVEEPGSLTIRPVEILLKTPRVADVLGISWSLRRVTVPFSGAGSFRLEAFAKRYRNQVRVLGRRYGELDQDYARRFPELEPVPGRAEGAMASTTLAFGARLHVQGSYTWQRVRQTYDGETAPTLWDIPEQLSAFAGWDLSKSWTIDAVFQAHSGVPITPVAARILVPGGNAAAFPGFADGPRNSLRVDPYRRLDLSAQRHWKTSGGKEWTVSLHLLNALARSNPVAIDWDQYYSALAYHARGGKLLDAGDTMSPSLPLLPSIGVRVQW
jgi:hypothetical protein